MDKHTHTEVDEIKSQLSGIRSVMNVSGSAFSLIYSADNFRSFFMLSGILSLAFPSLYQVLLFVYKTGTQIPAAMMVAFYGCMFLCWCALTIIRTRASVRMAKRLDISSGVWQIVKQVLATKMWLAILPVMLLLIAVPVKYAQAFLPRDYVPYFGIALGLMLNMIGVMIRETEYSACGLWMIVSGAAGLFFISVPTHIAFAVILAPACFIFVVANTIKPHHREHRDEAV